MIFISLKRALKKYFLGYVNKHCLCEFSKVFFWHLKSYVLFHRITSTFKVLFLPKLISIFFFAKLLRPPSVLITIRLFQLDVFEEHWKDFVDVVQVVLWVMSMMAGLVKIKSYHLCVMITRWMGIIVFVYIHVNISFAERWELKSTTTPFWDAPIQTSNFSSNFIFVLLFSSVGAVNESFV